MSFGGRAPPGPAGGAYCALRPLAALKLLAPWALDPWRLRRLASRLRRSETERSGSSFSHSNTGLAPYWLTHPFYFFDIRALWRSAKATGDLHTKFHPVVLEIMLSDRDRHTERRVNHNTPHPYRGGVKSRPATLTDPLS